MPIFELKGQQLGRIREISFKLERHIQELTEKNLKEVFGLDFIKSEMQLSSLRIDTLAFDPETKSFVIIEYKRDKSLSVIDQGYAYLALMLNNKAEFILEFNENMKTNLKRGDIDWSQSKVIFVADSFTPYQRKAIEFKDLPIELWEVSLFENNTVLFNHIKPAASVESIKTVSKSKTVRSVSREVKTYTIEDHTRGKPKEIIELLNALREIILNVNGDITEKAVKTYIGYKMSTGQNFASFHIYKSKIDIVFSRVHKEDLKNSKDVKNVKDDIKWYNLKLCTFSVKEKEDLAKAQDLIKQVYAINLRLVGNK